MNIDKSKSDTLSKWAPILENIGVTGSISREDWSQYAELHSLSEKSTDSKDFGNSLLPISMKIAAQTIGQNLVSVKPMSGITSDMMKEIKSDVMIENRDRKIDSIIDNKEFEEMKIEDHPEYDKGRVPLGLFYLDFNYSSSTTAPMPTKPKPGTSTTPPKKRRK